MFWRKKELASEPTAAANPVEARDLLSGTELAFVAYKIDNGYIIRMGNGLGLQAKVFFCANEQEIAEKVVAERAKKVVTGEKYNIAKSAFRVDHNQTAWAEPNTGSILTKSI